MLLAKYRRALGCALSDGKGDLGEGFSVIGQGKKAIRLSVSD